jgi:transposase-like protein
MLIMLMIYFRQRNVQSRIFVDETLLQIDEGQNYWLWIAYEPTINTCLMMRLSIGKNHFLRMLSVLQTATTRVWQKKANSH